MVMDKAEAENYNSMQIETSTLEGLNDFNHYNITAANTSRRDRRFRLPDVDNPLSHIKHANTDEVTIIS